MNQKVKRAIAAAMSLTMVATATPVSPLYNAIQNAVSSAMIQANAGGLDWEPIGESGLVWAIENTTLKIELNGSVTSAAMPDWEESMPVTDDSPAPPWAKDDIADKVTSVVIGEGITNIGNYAFYYNFNLENVTIPSSVTTIGEYAFSQTSELKNVQFVENSQLTTIGEGAFNGTALSSIEIPSSVTTISANAFKSCGIGSVTFGENSQLTTIGAYAFEGCSSLTSIELPNLLKTIGENAFEGCNCASFSAIEIPASVETIGEYAFFSCTSLSNVTFANGSKLTTIGEGAFQRCPANNITIPDSVTSIGKSAFLDCTNLTGITAPCTIKTNETNWKGCDATVNYTHPIKDGDDFCACHTTTNLSTCGDNLYYTLDEETGKLTIGLINPNETDKNKNAMPKWTSASNVPWDNQRDSIKSVEIGKDVTHIGDYAFCSCSALKAVTIPESVESIGVLAFSGCENLTELTFKGAKPSTENGAQAFKDVVNKNAQSVDDFPILHYPKGDKSWDDFLAVNVMYGALNWEGGCFKPEAYIPWNKIEDTNLQWAIDEGKLTIKLIEENGTDNAMPDWTSTTAVPWYSVKDSIKSVEIGKDVTHIGDYAFFNSSNLESIEFADGSQLETIGTNVFHDCDKLDNVIIPDSVTSIGDSAFGDCNKLSSITAPCTLMPSVETWLNDCSATVTYKHIFKTGETKCSCTMFNKIGDTNLQWAIDNGKLTIKLIEENGTDNAMPEWGNIGDVPWHNQRASITSVEIGKGVTSIGFAAFGSCSSLTSITIPDSVTSIKNAAFASCSALESITIPDSVTEIGTEVFLDCTNLTGITAPCTLKTTEITWKEGCNATVTYKHIFNHNYQNKCDCQACFTIEGKNLYYTLADNKLTIGLINPNETDKNKNAMPNWETTNLNPVTITTPWDSKRESIESVEIKDGVTNIGATAFGSCQNLTSVKIGDDVKTIGGDAFNFSTNLKTVIFGKAVESIGKLAFANTGLDSVVLPDTVKIIGDGAFSTCASLKSIVLSENLEEIGTEAFAGTAIESITIPAKVEKIGDIAFLLCQNLNTIKFEGNVPEMINDEENDDYGVFFGINSLGSTEVIPSSSKDKPATLYYPKGNASWETFLNGKEEVFEWEDGWFKAEAYIPWNKIEDTNLQWAIDEGKLTIKLIEENGTDNAMPEWGKSGTDDTPWGADKGDITSVEIKEGVTSIGNYAFYSCSSLKSITIPNSVTSIEVGAFSECSALENITIPDSVTSIGEQAFNKCSALTEVEIPESVTSINKHTFSSCSSLESIIIPDSVKSIGNSAFYKTPLKSVTLGSGVEIIDDFAFEECSGLTSITIPEKVKTIGEGAFYLCSSLNKIIFEGNLPTMIDKSEYYIEKYTYPADLSAFCGVGTANAPIELVYPANNTSWDNFIAQNKANIKNGVLSWESGYFNAFMSEEIEGTNLNWTLDLNGILTIDTIDKNVTGEENIVLAFDNDTPAPWKKYVNQINRVVISKDVEGVDDTSFTDFTGQAILVLDADYEGTMPDDINNSTYSSFGGGEFIYKTQLVGGSLSLDGQIGVNLSFYVNKDEGSTITINGETVDLSECEHEGDIYTYTLWVAPRDAYKDITFKTEKDSDTIVDQTYNVKEEYVDVVLEDKEHKTYSEDVYNMVSSLNLFINSSRIYFNEVDEDEEIKGSISTALEGLNLSGLDEYAPTIASESVEGIKYYGSSLILNSGVKLRHYIEIADYDNVKENIVIKLNDNAVENVVLEKASFTSNSHDVYYFETEEFNPKYFNTNVSVLYDEEDISEAISVIDNYSVLSFINLALNKNADTKLGTTCKSIYNYYLEAKDFKN